MKKKSAGIFIRFNMETFILLNVPQLWLYPNSLTTNYIEH